ncbi:Protein STIP1-like protein [Diplonema papillatum]|nr:Protein STIP1-like protein [Diplonema papillatum]
MPDILADIKDRGVASDENKQRALTFKDEGNAFFAKKQYRDAHLMYSRAIELDPSNYTFYSNRSGALVLMERLDEAIHDAQITTKLNAKFAKGWGRLGTALSQAGRFEEAVPAYEKAVGLDPASKDYKDSLAAAKLKAVRGQGIAGENTKKAFYVEKHKAQGLREFQAGNYVSAARYFTQALEIDPLGHVLLSNRAAAYNKQAAAPATPLSKAPEIYRQALADAERCIQLAPTFGKGYVRKGAALYGLTKFREARDAYQAGLAQEPGLVHLKDGLKAVEDILKDIEAEEQEFEVKHAANMEKDKTAEQNPDTCPIPDKKLPSVFCWKCGKEGHFPSNCREKILVGVAGGGYAHGYDQCKYCGEMGHKKAECPEWKRKMTFKKGGSVVVELAVCRLCGSSKHSDFDCPTKASDDAEPDAKKPRVS